MAILLSIDDFDSGTVSLTTGNSDHFVEWDDGSSGGGYASGGVERTGSWSDHQPVTFAAIYNGDTIVGRGSNLVEAVQDMLGIDREMGA